jgi:tRNA_anti-like
MVLLLVLPVASLTAQQSFPNTQIAKMDAASYLQPLPENRVVPLKVIAEDFASHPDAAIGKYKGKRITVIGRISALSQGSGENKVLSVTMQGSSGNLPAVKAQFLYDSIPVNSELQVSNDGSSASIIQRDRTGNILSQKSFLSVDQKVGIKGNFKEVKVGDIILTACKLLPKERLHQLENK